MKKYVISGVVCLLAIGLIFLCLNLISSNIEQSVRQKNQVSTENTSN